MIAFSWSTNCNMHENSTRFDKLSMEISSYCPAALSFIFKSCLYKNVAESGSIGIGCTINSGVTSTVKTSYQTKILFNNTQIYFPTVLSALTRLTPVPLHVSLHSPLPLGYGFGLSGASALSTLYAANKILKTEKTKKELALLAHKAEIENGTGLGTVATEITGGFLLKNIPGFPVDTVTFPFIGQKLYAIIIGKLTTPSILHDKMRMRKINHAADEALSKIRKMSSGTLEDIIDISYEFAKKSTLLHTSLHFVIEKVRQQGIHATMAMLGEVIICDKRPRLDNVRIEELIITDDTVELIY